VITFIFGGKPDVFHHPHSPASGQLKDSSRRPMVGQYRQLSPDNQAHIFAHQENGKKS